MSLSYVKHSHLGKATLTFGAISRINSARKFRHYHIASLYRDILYSVLSSGYLENFTKRLISQILRSPLNCMQRNLRVKGFRASKL